MNRLNDLYKRVVGRQQPQEQPVEPLENGARPLASLKVRIGQNTSIGNFRDNNEDRLFVDPNRHIYIVADGMGGQAAGEQASQIAVDMIPQQLRSLSLEATKEEVEQSMTEAVVAANEAILARGLSDPTLQNMGTTVVFSVLRGSNLFIGNIGDSRAYCFRDGKIHVLTKDHNLAEALHEAGTITKEELKTHRFRNVLYRYLGNKETGCDPDIDGFDLLAGDRYVLATDGLTGVLEDDVVRQELATHAEPQKCADRLVRMSLDAGSRDNVTCLVIFVDSV